MAVITGKSVYLDDAGHPVDKPFLVLGGFIASEANWIAFEKPWNEILKLHSISVPFHATDFFGEQAGNKKLKYITADLVRTIANYVDCSFSVALDMAAYKTINREKHLEECIGAPIAVISRVLRGNVNDWKKSVYDDSPVLYFMEQGTYQRGDMIKLWTLFDKIDPPIPVPKSHPSAQAADLYAYSVYQSAPFDSISWQHQLFVDSFRYKKVHVMDGRIMESDLRSSLAKKLAIMNGERMSIPDRGAWGDVDFTIKGDKNKQQRIRRAKIGLEKRDDGKGKLSSGIEASPQSLETGDGSPSGGGEAV